MKRIHSLFELYINIIENIENEWIYANMEEWATSPENCDFYIIPEAEMDEMPDDEVYESEAGPLLPINLQKFKLWPWMEIATLQGIVENLNMMEMKKFDADLLIKSINHYREFDDFLNVGD